MSTHVNAEKRYPVADAVASKFLVTSTLYLVVVGLIGVLMAITLSSPKTLPWLTFSDVRAIHLQGIIFGWLSQALFGAFYYTVPRLVGRDLYSKFLADLVFVLLQVGIAAVVVTLLMGMSEGREYLEPIQIIDFAVVVIWLLFAGNLFATVFTAPKFENSPSLSFLMVSVMYLGINFLIGMIPFEGVRDNLAIWWFAHNEVNGWFMYALMGLMYFILPKLTGLEGQPRPYDMKLSSIHFWALMVFIPPSVLHHLLYREAPVTEFWKEMGQWTSVGMLLPTFVWTYIFSTYIRNAKKPLGITGKFFIASMAFYVLNCVQGSMQSIRAVNDITHGTQWVVGHAHLALVGYISFGVFALIYYYLTEALGWKLHSESLADAHLWLTIVGFLAMFIPLTIAGVVQGTMMEAGQSWYAARQAIQGYIDFRVLGGVVTLLGFITFFYNIFKTAISQSAPAGKSVAA